MRSRFAFSALVAAVVSGCMHTSERDFAQVRKPVMPTVTPPSASASRTPLSDDEVVAAALRAVRADDWAEAARLQPPIDEPARRLQVATEIATTLTQEDPARAAVFAANLPTGRPQAAALEIAMRAWVLRDRAAALRWAHALTDSAVGRLARATIAEQLVASDPRAAVDQVRTLAAGRARDETLVITAAAWARRDPDGALGWARSLPEDEMKPRLTSAVGFEIAQRQPDRAVALAEMVPAGRNRWLLFSAIGQTWVAVDSKAALAWANQLPAGEPRDAALAGVDTGLGVPASRRIAGAPGTRGGSSRTRGSAAAVAHWPEVNSPDFAAWLATQPAGLSRDEAILEYVRQRGALQPGAVGQWLATLPGGPARDRAMEIYLDALLLGSPRDAARWLGSLPRSDRTDPLIERTTRRWLMRHPEAADALLQDPTLPGYLKDRLLRDAGR